MQRNTPARSPRSTSCSASASNRGSYCWCRIPTTSTPRWRRATPPCAEPPPTPSKATPPSRPATRRPRPTTSSAVTNFQRYQTLFQIGAVSRQSLDNAEQAVNAAQAAVDTWAHQLMAGSSAAVISKQAARDKAQGGIDALRHQRDDMIMNRAAGGEQSATGRRRSATWPRPDKNCCRSSTTAKSTSTARCPNTTSARSRSGHARRRRRRIPRQDLRRQDHLHKPGHGRDHPVLHRPADALDGVDDTLKAGMFARTEINILLRPQTLFVPKEAVISLNGKERMYVVDGDNKVTERVVTARPAQRQIRRNPERRQRRRAG